MCSEDDLKSIGLPLGPRKKLMGFLKEHEQSLSKAVVAPTPVQQAIPDTPKLTADAVSPVVQWKPIKKCLKVSLAGSWVQFPVTFTRFC